MTGLLAPPPPPSAGAPPSPTSPPPAPLPPYGFQFNGASDACTNSGLYHGAECRDGGVGSVYPHYCDYGSQYTKCGARPYHNNGEIIGDDSCIYAHNGQCEDGGPGSSFYTDVDVNGFEYQAAACAYATDRTDCEPIGGLRTLQSLGPLSYAYPGQPHPPLPLPPPSPPSSPPPPPPAYTFASCVDTCGYTTLCSDGGAGAHLVVSNGVRQFMCDYGTQCAQCGTRRDELLIASDSCTLDDGTGCARNGLCEDTVASGSAGYGTDTADRAHAVRQVAGEYPDATTRRTTSGSSARGCAWSTTRTRAAARRLATPSTHRRAARRCSTLRPDQRL